MFVHLGGDIPRNGRERSGRAVAEGEYTKCKTKALTVLLSEGILVFLVPPAPLSYFRP